MLATCAMLVSMAVASAKIDQFAWMSGTWTGMAFGGAIEEAYGSASGGCILGTSRVVVEGKSVHKEFIALEERDGSVVYEVVLPNKTHAFKLREVGQSHAVWEDLTNAWPSTITYRRTGSTMHVELDGKAKDGARRLESIDMTGG